ncbi:MAG: alpha-L-fucosidase [Planctomycetes bacterium]|nr:alpha-L-fucosidase [Planctomycetota bacterium]
MQRSLLLSTTLFAAACGTPARPTIDTAAAPPSHDARMQWWREARFGLFLHWGLYAIPAGKWQDQTGYGEWIRDSARIPRDVYAEFQPHWNPTGFDADAWARMAKAAGMKYVVITSKHHDGFCLWNSAQTGWDVGNTPHRRDILRELADACRREGLVFCTYHSIMDWHHPDYLPRRPWETDRSSQGADFAKFERYLHAQVSEVIERYRPGVMWFDGEWENTWNHERGVRLFELCRTLAPGMIVNNRVDVHRGGMAGFSNASEAVGDFATPEQEIPATGLPGVDWESCMTMNTHWGFNAADTKWKSTQDLVRNLIDIASKGGNYLLNVGPRADGTFPPESVDRLREIGAWMAIGGEAIHGTTASVFDALPFGRCTVRQSGTSTTLYLHVFDLPADGLLALPGLTNTIRSARVLGGKGSATPMAASAAGAAAIRLDGVTADPIATVVAVDIDGAPDVVRRPVIVAESDQFVHGIDVVVTQTSRRVLTTYTLDGTPPTAGSPRADAPIRVTQSGVLRTASFVDGRALTDVVERTFTKVDPLPPVKAMPGKEGLYCERFAVAWDRIPDDRTALVPQKKQVVGSVGPVSGTGERVAFVYKGFLKAPADDLYRFALTSDDGSKLWIDGQLVVDNDGLHGAIEKRGAVGLGKGVHSIEVVWFNQTGGAELGLKWARPGQPFQVLEGESLLH